MALNGTSEQIVLDCDFSYDSEDQLLVSSFRSICSSHLNSFDADPKQLKSSNDQTLIANYIQHPN